MLLNFVPQESYMRSGRDEGQIYFCSYVTNILLLNASILTTYLIN
jgi:hypothetical protein